MFRDHVTKQSLRSFGIPFYSFNADLLYKPWEVLDDEKQPFTSFKKFWDFCLTQAQPPVPPSPAPTVLPAHTDDEVSTLTVDDLCLIAPEEEAFLSRLARRWEPGENSSAARLKAFMRTSISSFDTNHAKADRASTSQLSAHLHFGEISCALIWYMMQQTEAELSERGVEDNKLAFDKFRRHIGFREYSRYLSYHFPYTHERAMLQHLNACPWEYNREHFLRWQQGTTGYPLIDAGMRELRATAWTHNRLRRLTASFCVKHLLLPWQWGLKYFWDALIDADLEQDSLGWQYVSGGIVDGLSFDKLDDPVEEGKIVDPDGRYVKLWVPELAKMPVEYIHAPWMAPPEVLASAGVVLGPMGTYPHPIVTHEEAQRKVSEACRVIEEVFNQQNANVSVDGGCSVFESMPDPVLMEARNAMETVSSGDSGVSSFNVPNASDDRMTFSSFDDAALVPQ